MDDNLQLTDSPILDDELSSDDLSLLHLDDDVEEESLDALADEELEDEELDPFDDKDYF